MTRNPDTSGIDAPSEAITVEKAALLAWRRTAGQLDARSHLLGTSFEQHYLPPDAPEAERAQTATHIMAFVEIAKYNSAFALFFTTYCAEITVNALRRKLGHFFVLTFNSLKNQEAIPCMNAPSDARVRKTMQGIARCSRPGSFGHRVASEYLKEFPR